MNRFDRVTAILVQLQTKRVVTAQELAEKYEVSLRTIYRDIRTLENAGVPIGAEAGIGYFLDKGYQLPPVMFTQEEAAALLVGEKFVKRLNDSVTAGAYGAALDKIKAVLSHQDKAHLDTLSQSIDVYSPQATLRPEPENGWLVNCQRALSQGRVIHIRYHTHYRDVLTEREVEPIGLYHYSNHWHMIAWCRYREDYRDFRLDRIQAMTLQQAHFSRRSRQSLDEYLQATQQKTEMHRVRVQFRNDVVEYLGEQRYYFGFVAESEVEHEGAVEMEFLTPSLEYFARWLLSYTDAVEVLEPIELQQQMQKLVEDVSRHLKIKAERFI